MADTNVKKTLQTRIALKYDTYDKWTTAPGKDLVLLAGELGICSIGSTNPESHVVPTVLFKVGDGTTTFANLPWASAKAADVYSWAKASEVKLETETKKLIFVGGGVDGANLEISFDYATSTEVENLTATVSAHIGDKNNPHAVTKAQVGLDKVENMSVEDIRQKLMEGGAVDAANTNFVVGAAVYTAIEAAKTAIAGAAAKDAAAKVSALKEEQNAEISKVANAVSDEAKAREDADKALSDRIDSIDAFFAAADYDGEEGGLNDALDTLKEIQDYLDGEGSATGGIIDRVVQAETDIGKLDSKVSAIADDYLAAADFFIIDCGSSVLREGEPVAPINPIN